jgi:hypothetical protein
MAELITKQTLADEAKKRILSGQVFIANPVEVSETRISGKWRNMAQLERFEQVSRAKKLGSFRNVLLSGKYLCGFDVPFEGRGSINDRIDKRTFGSTNTLNTDWQDLWDALRIDLSIRKEANPTIRQFMYNEIVNPNFTRTITPQEMFPYGIVFEENNAEGQPVRQGEKLDGQYDSVTLAVYAAGFTWTLLAELFDRALDMTRLNEGVTLGYNAIRDNLAISPITAYDYSTAGTAKHTAADTTGTLRQEKLYNTLEDAIDDLSQRSDPVTGRKISANGLMCLASEYDARHIARVINGLPSVNERKYPGISEVSQVIGYDGETIVGRNETTTYSGITSGYAYLIKPNRYMAIPIKRGLTMEIDQTPDVKTLSREERAWYFVEGLYDLGIGYFIQKITLPTW